MAAPDVTTERVAALVDELTKANAIIAIALNALTGADRSLFFASVMDAGLGGDGVTRANERAALLADIASHPDDGCLDCLRHERSGGAA